MKKQPAKKELQYLTDQLEDITAKYHSVYDSLNETTKFIELSRKLTVTANEADTYNEALHKCIEHVARFMGWPIGHVYFTATKPSPHMVPSRIWYLSHPKKFSTFKKVTDKTSFDNGKGLPGRILKNGKPAWIKDVMKDKNFPRNTLAKNLGVKAGFGFPVLVKKEVVAVMEFFSEEAIEPNEYLLELLEQTGTQLGRIMEREQLMELGEFKEAITGMIVHDFKNALNTVISFSDGMPSARRLKSIKNASRHMLNMALNMLDVQKYETTEVALGLAINSIPKVINEALEQVSFLLEQKSLKLTHKLDDNLYSNCDLALITRVIVNLLTNAIKYTPTNGSIHIEAVVQDKFVKLSFSDTGQGIPKDKLQMIFEKFAQVEVKKSGVVRSTGLGLTFSKMIVEAHRGNIGVESEEGKRSTFWFTLQKAKAPKDSIGATIDIDLYSASATIYELTEKDKAILQPVMQRLRQWEVYDYSDVKEILSSIKANGNPAITNWLDDMYKALQNVNEEQYNELVTID